MRHVGISGGETESFVNDDADAAGSGESVYEALQAEYRDMAHWYDRFWADYLDKTFALPLDLVRSAILEENDGESTRHCVDIGCGTGEFLKRLSSSKIIASECSFVGVEPSPHMLAQARRKFEESSDPEAVANCHFIEAPAESIPLGNGIADVVCSTSAFHFFRNKAKALQEMHRIMKPGSQLIISDWCADYFLVKIYHLMERIRWNFFHNYSHPYPGPLGSKHLKQIVMDAGFGKIDLQTYRVRIFGIWFWGMQTIKAVKS